MTWRVLALVLCGALLIGGALWAVGVTPMQALFGNASSPHAGLITGSLGAPDKISGTLRETTPLLILGLSVFLALRAGLFNIGADGQFLVGALACTYVALRLPGIPGMLLGTVAGVVAGALWALPAGLIKAYRGGHEVITTIMLNNVAGFLTGALVAGPLHDKTDESPTTVSLASSTMIPNLYNHAPSAASPILTVNASILVGLAGAVLLALWLRRTVGGYELRAVGQNPTAATFAGISTQRVLVRAMTVSGALGGLAGAIQVLAYEGRFYSGFSPGYGFDALGVALLAGGSAICTIPAALLFGVLSKGGTSIQFLGVPKGITTVVLGILILIAAAIRYRNQRLAHE